MQRITRIVSLLALFAVIFIGGATVGATVEDSQPSEPPRGLRRMLQTLDAPNVANMEISPAFRQALDARIR